jgi:NAD+ synthase
MEMEKLGQDLDSKLQFDTGKEIERICDFIRSEVKRRGSRGVVLGLSGGWDSSACAYLCARCLFAEQIHLYSLPERDSNPGIHSHARLVAQALGLPLEERNISELFNQLGLYDGVPQAVAGDRAVLKKGIKILSMFSRSKAFFPWAQQFGFSTRKGFLAWILRRRFWKYVGITEKFILGKVRARSLMLSTRAMELDCLLICTSDRSEWSVGFYDPHGDGVGDIAPLLHLYKTQIRALARALDVPEEIIQTPPSGDLAAGLPNEVPIGLPYEQLDLVLEGFALGMADAKIASGTGVRRSVVKSIRSACQVAEERRSMPVRVEERE